MARLVTLYTLQGGDLPLETVCEKAKSFGYDGLELGLPNHVDVRRTDAAYYEGIKGLLGKYGLEVHTISTHLIGQAVCDNIDFRFAVSPDIVGKDGLVSDVVVVAHGLPIQMGGNRVYFQSVFP